MRKGFAIALIIAAVAASAFLSLKTDDGAKTSANSCDLTNHPAYGKYDFGRAEGVIDIGTQPTAAIIGPLAQCLKRDRVLREELSSIKMELRFHPFAKGPDVNFFLERGDVEAATGGDMPVITAAAKFDIVVPSLLGRLFNSIVAKEHMLIEELKGKRIGYSHGTNAHYTLLRALSFSGLGKDDVTLVKMEMPEMPGALRDGRIDAFSACEPTPTVAAFQGPLPSGAEGFRQTIIHKTQIVGFLYFSRAFALSHPEAVRRIIAAQIRAYKWLQEDENLLKACGWALKAERDFTGKEPDIALKNYAALNREGIEAASPVPSVTGRELETGQYLHGEFEFFKRIGKVPASADWGKVRASFDRETALQILMSPEKYKLGVFDYE